VSATTWVERVAARAKVDPSDVVAMLAAIAEEGVNGPMIAAGVRGATEVKSSDSHANNPRRVIGALLGGLKGAQEEHASVMRARAPKRPPGF